MKIAGKEAVADAAMDIIAFEGIDKLSMNTLAEHLGLKKASIYHWFPSKEEMLDYLFSRGHPRLMAKGFRLSLERSAEEVLGRDAEGWRGIFSSDDTLPFLRTLYALRYSDARAEEEARSIRLMIQSQIDVLISSLGVDDKFLSLLFSSLLLQHLEAILEGGNDDFSRDAASFASLLAAYRKN